MTPKSAKSAKCNPRENLSHQSIPWNSVFLNSKLIALAEEEQLTKTEKAFTITFYKHFAKSMKFIIFFPQTKNLSNPKP